MEEERMSISIKKPEASDSNSSNSPPQRPKTVTRPNKQNGGSSRFKGVVYQQNGHWGAQIYANHHRIWLGTFKTQAAAAAAYDSAAMKLRHGNSNEAHRNFPWTALTMYEPNFQAQYSNDQVLNMIKDGSYQTKFGEFLSSISQLKNQERSNHNTNNQNNQEGYFYQELFRKELTPSDVGKLNRLVIPKRYALKYFPVRDNDGEEMELIFYDKTMKSWNFRYCYWRSSQSFVFTRGWNKFVRVNGLEAKDTVTFYLYEFREKNDEDLKKIWMIDIVKSDIMEGGVVFEDEKAMVVDEEDETENKKAAGFRLFGVQLVPSNYD